ncbi:hypothetical protein CISG_10237 [Coccidioides immitis RMSCC 3703]|uniref:Extensin n=1 Tax=Coccidioides immitis RMSCC 3703 TaxID=454286 RepID=A0A0J8QND1_COCIT|nr:hypothetical protein CISG_10237 [Coccidioides immitis RMSCC 3703]
MPPPSPPPLFQSRATPIQPSFAPRDPPAPSPSSHRTGSSMPIASMLGSDPEKPSREPSSSSLFSRPPIPSMSAGTTGPSASGKMSPPPAPTRQPAPDYPPFGRSHTPDRSIFSKPSPRPYRPDSRATVLGTTQTAADDSRVGSLSRSHAGPAFGDRQMPQSPRSAYVESSYASTDRRLSLGAPIQRPNSQPQHLPQSDEAPARTSLFSPIGRSTPGFGDKGPGHQRSATGYAGVEGHPHAASRFSGVPSEHHGRDLVSRDHVQEPGHQHQPQVRYGQHHSDRDERQSRAPWEPNLPRLSPEPGRYPSGESVAGHGFGGLHTYTKSLGSQPGAPRSLPGPQLQPRQEPSPSQESSPSATRRFPNPRLYSPAPGPRPPPFSGPGTEEHHPPRVTVDEQLHHRTILNLNAENKRGRVSPLPQAVQGAQAQLIGPAGEPGIQSELGRVFSGIGSGVGVSGSGPPTPLGSSSFRKDVTGRPLNSEYGDAMGTGAKPSRSNSRRSRRIKDEEAREDSESTNAQRETSLVRGGGASRRARHVHHHHHHGHHHHHHRHRPDDDTAHSVAQPGGSSQPPTLADRTVASSATFYTASSSSPPSSPSPCPHDPAFTPPHQTAPPCSGQRIKDQHQHAPHPTNGAFGSSHKNGPDGKVKSESDDKQKAKHRIPPIPPPDKDLHITLLILPPLERYESSVMYGLKSRPWGNNHDGMSFKVESIEWVDEGGSKGQERGGEARRKRLKSMMRSGRICTAAGMKGRAGVEFLKKKGPSGMDNGPRVSPASQESAQPRVVETVS